MLGQRQSLHFSFPHSIFSKEPRKCENREGHQFHMGPFEEIPVGNFLTCCNKSSVAKGLEFFSKNRRDLSIYLHPITNDTVKDHTSRIGWIGPSFPLDESKFYDYKGEPPMCW
ncbi:hypothetical protein B4U80_13102 [Leptotrombidium deliense]|uniref:Uncharacterized protein n=1 Tax=Leptotrombidium deliense TaxID=299467 RepID=A0A443SCT8_9ACAR|nr:hypothetical protein B4U80_13102 [Leptotrombidium deliense]